MVAVSVAGVGVLVAGGATGVAGVPGVEVPVSADVWTADCFKGDASLQAADVSVGGTPNGCSCGFSMRSSRWSTIVAFEMSVDEELSVAKSAVISFVWKMIKVIIYDCSYYRKGVQFMRLTSFVGAVGSQEDPLESSCSLLRRASSTSLRLRLPLRRFAGCSSTALSVSTTLPYKHLSLVIHVNN